MEGNKEARESKEPSPFLSGYNEIISRDLTVDNVNTYATDALNDLIILGDRMVESYQNELALNLSHSKDLEDSAFNHYGIPDIESALDHIAEVSHSLRALDLIADRRTKRINKVITPPDSAEISIVAGDGSGIAERVIRPRLKTVLFILQTNFDVNLNDSEEIKLTTGIVTPNMMRQTSYTLVEVPSLQRSILVCDEEGNATFVIDSSLLGEDTIRSEDLIYATKDDINGMIDSHKGFGRRIVESKKNYVPKIIKAIEDLSEVDDANDETGVEGKYLTLTESAPEGIKSVRGMAAEFGTDKRNVLNAISQLEKNNVDLGGRTYRFSNNPAIGYDLSAQMLIRQKLDENGVFVESAPEGALSIRGIAVEVGIDKESVSAIIDQLEQSGIDLGGKTYKFRNGKNATGYDVKSQAIIRQELDKRGFLSEIAPEGVKTVYKISKEFGTSESTINKIIGQLDQADVSLGGRRYRFGYRIAVGYGAQAQELIKQKLDSQRGALADPAPEGVLSVAAMTKKFFRANDQAINKAIKQLEEAGVDLCGKVYSFGGANNTIGDGEQAQELIRQELDKREDLDVIPAPEGITTAYGMAQELQVHKLTIDKIIKQIEQSGVDLGGKKYKFGRNKIATGYGEDAQKIIRQELTRLRG